MSSLPSLKGLPRLVIVPGLGDSGPEHWQSLWEQKFGAARVRQDDPENPAPQSWAARLQEVVEATPGDLVLVAHSCGVPTVAHWAQLYPVSERVKGALLVAPPDTENATLQREHPAACQMAPVPLLPPPLPGIRGRQRERPLLHPGARRAVCRRLGRRVRDGGRGRTHQHRQWTW